MNLSLWTPIYISLISKQTSWFCITYIYTFYTIFFHRCEQSTNTRNLTDKKDHLHIYNTSSVCLLEVITVMNAFCCQGALWLRMFNDPSTDWSDRFILWYDVNSNWLQACGLGQSHQLPDTSQYINNRSLLRLYTEDRTHMRASLSILYSSIDGNHNK